MERTLADGTVIPCDALKAEIISLCEVNNKDPKTDHPAYYLQKVRTLPKGDDRLAAAKKIYEEWKPQATEELAQRVSDFGRYDLVFRAPTDLPLVDAFLDKIIPHVNGPDVTALWTKVPGRNSTHAKSCDAFQKFIEFNPLGVVIQERRSILIVDDVVSTEKTWKALVSVMQGHGLPRDACVTVACVLRVKEGDPSHNKEALKELLRSGP